MNKFFALTFGILGTAMCLAPTPAMATRYRMTFGGTVYHIATLNDDLSARATPLGVVNLGDAYKLSFDLDATGTPDSYFDADPKINIYSTNVRNMTSAIGSYHFKKVSPGNVYASVQLWNDYPISNLNVDAFNISMGEFKNPSSPLPFAVSPGSNFESFQISAYDFSGTARQSDLISEITPFSGFANQTFAHALGVPADKYTVVVLVNGVTASISAVPEPATWSLMTFGFAMIGQASRRRVQRGAAFAHR